MGKTCTTAKLLEKKKSEFLKISQHKGRKKIESSEKSQWTENTM